jgi:hypothetical protein
LPNQGLNGKMVIISVCMVNCKALDIPAALQSAQKLLPGKLRTRLNNSLSLSVLASVKGNGGFFSMRVSAACGF